MEEIIQELKALANEEAPALKPRSMKHESNKWIIRSAMQKAVRRGDSEEALRCGEYLYTQQASYFWHSMAIISVEDIGLADPDAVTYCLALANRTTLWKKVPVKPIARALIRRMCEGPKTRSCCELSLAAELHFQDIKKELYALPDEDLVNMIRPVTGVKREALMRSLITRYHALCILRGRSEPPQGMQRRGTTPQRNQMALMKMMEDEYPYDVTRSAMFSFEGCRDTMHIAMYVLASTWCSLKDKVLVDDPLPVEVPIKSLSSSAFDMHTQTGKLALKAFYTSLSKDYPIIKNIPEDKAIGALGATVFVEEGGLEKQRVMSPFLQELKNLQDSTFMLHKGIKEADHDAVREIVRKEMVRLNNKRGWAAKL